MRRGLVDPFEGTDQDAVNELDVLLRHSVASRMTSDVPLGAFLSGGIDSSLVVALMQAQSSRPVHTFSIGFEDTKFDEAPFARRIADHLGTHHTEQYVTGKDALDVVPRLPALFDEPFADSSQIPTFLVCAMARKHVTVALSGDAGDELFGGYERYLLGHSLWKRLSVLPPAARGMLARLLERVPPRWIDRLSTHGSRFLPTRLRGVPLSDKLTKLAAVIDTNEDTFYLRMMSHWKEPLQLVRGARHELSTTFLDRPAWPEVEDFSHRMMHIDLETYLPGDILVKVDRAAMGVSLETRVPLLDPALVEFAWRIPTSMKVRAGSGKWIMRELLARHLPRNLFERPKRGFGVPLAAWLRGPLRDWAETLLAERRLTQEGYLNTDLVRRRWLEHLRGTHDWHYSLWDVLMFQAWFEGSATKTRSQ
jgi:asparagine synthase (glutamine-hydrolysing)